MKTLIRAELDRFKKLYATTIGGTNLVYDTIDTHIRLLEEINHADTPEAYTKALNNIETYLQEYNQPEPSLVQIDTTPSTN